MRREPGTYGIVPNWVFEAIHTLRSPSEIRILLELARQANFDYKSAAMTTAELYGVTGLDPRSIQVAVKSLEQAGYIVRDSRTYCLAGASAELPQESRKSPARVPQESRKTTRFETPKNIVQHDEKLVSEELEGLEDLEEQNIKHTHIQISEPVPVSDSANAPSDVCEIPDSNFWEEMPTPDELELIASLEHQGEIEFVPSQETSIKKIELEQKPQPDKKNVPSAAGGPVDKSPAKFNPREVDLPESIPREAWLEWCQHRTEKRSPLTPISVKKQLAQLLEFGATGQTPQESIDHAIAHSWQGFYPIRKARAGGYVGKPQTTQEANERMGDSAAALYAACLEQDRAKAAQRSLNA